MSALDYSDEGVIKEELRKLVDREMGSVFADLDKAERSIEALAGVLEGARKAEVEDKLERVREGKFEAVKLFKGMHDFLQ